MTDGMSRARPLSRSARHAEVRSRFLEAAISLLSRPGTELSMRAVAREAGTSERTVYRYFASLAALQEATIPLVAQRISAPFPGAVDELPAYVDALFGRFESERDLVRGLVAWLAARDEPFPTRVHHLGAWRALLDRAFPDASHEDRAAVAAASRALVSGDGWCHLRFGCGLGNAEVRAAARRALALLLASLRPAS